MERITYQSDLTAIHNPERGMFGWVEIIANTENTADFSSVRTGGFTLAFMPVPLHNFINDPIPDTYLYRLEETFAAARGAGIKLIPRVAYQYPEKNRMVAPTIEQIERHVAQLSPVFERNADTIFVVQAGLIGPWGEWHGLEPPFNTPAGKQAVIQLAFALAPTNRQVQFRHPAQIVDILSTQNTIDLSRLGHHNDCFLADATDVGTYEPASRVTEFKESIRRIANAGAAVGGETCSQNPANQRTACSTAISEMEAYNWTFLNGTFFKGALDRWRKEGCYHEISNRLGYRLSLTSAALSPFATPGERFDLEIDIRNDGFAAPINARNAYLVLQGDNGRRVQLPLIPVSTTQPETPYLRSASTADIRRWTPNPRTRATVRFSPRLPETLPAGTYTASIFMPDPSQRLATVPDYAIRFANVGMWQPDSGLNSLSLSLTVTSR